MVILLRFLSGIAHETDYSHVRGWYRPLPYLSLFLSTTANHLYSPIRSSPLLYIPLLSYTFLYPPDHPNFLHEMTFSFMYEKIAGQRRRNHLTLLLHGSAMVTAEAIPSSSFSFLSSFYNLDAYTIVHNTKAERRTSSNSSADPAMQQAENSWKPHAQLLPILPIIFSPSLLVPPNACDSSYLGWPYIDTNRNAVQELRGNGRSIFT